MNDFVIPVCWSCVVGLHEECFDPQLVQPEELEVALRDDEAWVTCCCKNNPTPDAQAFVNGVGRPMLDPSQITDITSTGRKRAAMLYPIFEGMVCEWAGLLAAGGGVYPIVGCAGNALSEKRGGYARHHGPDKNVINNTPGNVHRICPSCHNYWHALNNEFYEGERPSGDTSWLPVAPEGLTVFDHDAVTLATEEEIEEAHVGRTGATTKELED